MSKLAAVLSLVVLTATACAATPEPGTAIVREVVDGDTIKVRIGRSNETVRLIGIDTPETVHPDKPVECFGPEASARTKQLLPEGTTIRVERDAEAKDRYGRLLLYVFVEDRMINETLIIEGFARPMSIAPNTSRSAVFDRLAADARSRGAGLWSACRQ